MSGSERWFWEKINAGSTAVSGDFSKEFKNETVKQPGVFAADPVPGAAVLLVREAIQNSWDAARERYISDNGGGGGAREFRGAVSVPRTQGR